MSFIKELRRRNVIRVAMAYMIAAWLLLQVADVVTNNIGAPGWVFQAILLLVALGFPIALIFAWAFELTPEGLKREHEVDRSDSITQVTGRKLDFMIIGVMSLAIAYFAYDEFVVEPAQEESLLSDSTQEIVATEVQQSIAVLPFVNMSDDAANEYFSDGLAEELLNLLAKIPELKVIARTSSFAFKGQTGDIRGIGQQLGVKTLLEGSVRKSGERVRITAQLIDASDGAHIWSDTYDRTIKDIFAVQDDVAAAIIDALEIHIGAKPTRGRPTDNAEAYALFLKARASLNVSDTRSAEQKLLGVIELDPNFAEAHELLAYCYFYLCGRDVSGIEGQILMRDAAARALAINPDLVLAEALYQAGNVESWSYLGEIEAFERAMRRQPGDTKLLDTLIWDVLEAGYLQEALELAEQFVELDPLSPTANFYLAEALFAVGRTSESIAAMNLAIEFNHELAENALGAMNLVNEQDDIAIAHFEAVLERNELPSNWVSDLVTGARDPATGMAYLDRRIPEIIASLPEDRAADWRQNLNDWYLYFGYLDRYFDTIFALDLTSSTWTDADTYVYRGTQYRHLGFTAHPKYLEVAESTGMIDVWEHRGPPDFCEKMDGQWVCE